MKLAAQHFFRNKIMSYNPRRRLAWQLLLLGCATWLLANVAIAQTWKIEVLDSDSGHDLGQFSAFAIDHDGDFHLAYWDATGNAPRGQLWYAFRAPGDKQWSRMIVDQDGTYLSMAVDGNDRPHLAYSSKRETGLHYTYWDGSKWHKQVVDSGKINYFNSIQLDAKGHPKISYYLYHLPTGEYSLHLKYAYFDGKAWYIQTVDSRMHTGKMNSLALDQKGNPHIAYSYLATTHDMLYAHWDGSRWQLRTADASKNEPTLLSYGNNIAVDSKGHPHLTYFDNVKNNVKFASWDGSRWSTEVVDHVASVDHLDRIALKMDSEDRPHLAYYDAGAGMLKYAVRGLQGWEIEIVDRQGNVGLRPSLAFDQQNRPYICYYDLTNHSLRLAHRELIPASNVAAKR